MLKIKILYYSITKKIFLYNIDVYPVKKSLISMKRLKHKQRTNLRFKNYKFFTYSKLNVKKEFQIKSSIEKFNI